MFRISGELGSVKGAVKRVQHPCPALFSDSAILQHPWFTYVLGEKERRGQPCRFERYLDTEVRFPGR